MDDLIKMFHIDWKLLTAQMINFVIVIGALGIFALKPLVKLMKEREEKIENGVKNAEEMEDKLKEVEKLKQAEIKNGRKEGQDLIHKAEKDAESVRQEKLQKTISEIEKMAKDARGRIREERDEMIKEAKDELGGLIAKALKKVTNEVVDEKTHVELIDTAINELEQQTVAK